MGTVTMQAQAIGPNRFAVTDNGEVRGEVFASRGGWTAAVYTVRGKVRNEQHATRAAAEAAVLFAPDGVL